LHVLLRRSEVPVVLVYAARISSTACTNTRPRLCVYVGPMTSRKIECTMRRVRPRPPRATPTARRSDDSAKTLTVRASSRLEESAEAWKSNSTLTSSALPGRLHTCTRTYRGHAGRCVLYSILLDVRLYCTGKHVYSFLLPAQRASPVLCKFHWRVSLPLGQGHVVRCSLRLGDQSDLVCHCHHGAVDVLAL